MKTTRRGLFGIFAGALAAPAVAKIAPEQGLTGLFAEDANLHVIGKPSVEFCFPTGYEDLMMHDINVRYFQPASEALAHKLDAHLAAFNRHLSTSAVNLSRFPLLEDAEEDETEDEEWDEWGNEN